MSDTLLIRNARIVTEDGVIERGTVEIRDGRIASVTADDNASPSVTGAVDAAGGWLVPGFIDVHVHGGYGHDFMDASSEAYDTITRFHAKHGTTSMLATTVTAPRDAIEKVLEAVHSFQQRPMPGAQLIGVHLEGPFISPKWPGAQNPAYIVPPQLDWVQDWVARYPSLIRMLTLAPESEGAFPLIEWLSQQGIIAAAGHTDASYSVIAEAVRHGLRHAVHTYNAMTGLHHRQPGTVGAVLTHDEIKAEIIADGIHVHPAAINVLTKTKTKDNLIVITDAISAAGLGDGLYNLGGLDVVVKDNVATLKEGSSLAGSTLTMIRAFRYMVEQVGLDVPAVSRLASENPAKQFGIYGETGSIATGKRADVLLLSPSLDLQQVWIGGQSYPL